MEQSDHKQLALLPVQLFRLVFDHPGNSRLFPALQPLLGGHSCDIDIHGVCMGSREPGPHQTVPPEPPGPGPGCHSGGQLPLPHSAWGSGRLPIWHSLPHLIDIDPRLC